MDTPDKRKVNPRSIDEKAILEIVAGKGSRLSVIPEPSPAPSSPHPQPDVVKATPPASPATGKRVPTNEQRAAFIANFLNIPRSASSTTLHIATGMHQRVSSLVWAIGDKKATVAGVANRILELFFEQNEELVHSIIEKQCESFKTK